MFDPTNLAEVTQALVDSGCRSIFFTTSFWRSFECHDYDQRAAWKEEFAQAQVLVKACKDLAIKPTIIVIASENVSKLSRGEHYLPQANGKHHAKQIFKKSGLHTVFVYPPALFSDQLHMHFVLERDLGHYYLALPIPKESQLLIMSKGDYGRAVAKLFMDMPPTLTGWGLATEAITPTKLASELSRLKSKWVTFRTCSMDRFKILYPVSGPLVGASLQYHAEDFNKDMHVSDIKRTWKLVPDAHTYERYVTGLNAKRAPHDHLL